MSVKGYEVPKKNEKKILNKLECLLKRVKSLLREREKE